MERTDVLELLLKRSMDGDVDFLMGALSALVDGIMEAGVSAQAGAWYAERRRDRITQRNSCRTRAWDTPVSTKDLHIPNIRVSNSMRCRNRAGPVSAPRWRCPGKPTRKPSQAGGGGPRIG